MNKKIEQKKVYFIGIAGKAMGSLAKAYQDLGWFVSGSDHQGIYPPISTYLNDNHIPYKESYRVDNLPDFVDLVVVGRSALLVDPNNPEYLESLARGWNVVSYPQALAEILIKKHSLVIAGSYGKTTTTALLAWIFQFSGLNPSYMVGGIAPDLVDGVKITDSQYSIVEGDEPPALAETDPPKFMYYKPTQLLLTATQWDHPEIYKTDQSYQQAFINLLQILPPDGLLLYQPRNVHDQVSRTYFGKKITYSFDSSTDYSATPIAVNTQSQLLIKGPSGWKISVTTNLIGKANFENLVGAVALAHENGLPDDLIVKAVLGFQGIKTRLELVGSNKGVNYYWDIAQHPNKVAGSLAALRMHYPKSRIITVFHPAMSALHFPESLDWYSGRFKDSDYVFVAKMSFTNQKDRSKRVTGPQIANAIAADGCQVSYEPLYESLRTKIDAAVQPGDVVVFMSSGGLEFSDFIKRTVG